MPTRPYRSLLYIPGSNERALAKATELPADGIILDLEDAVAPDDKARARQMVAETLATRAYGGRALMVRINGFDTPWSRPDLEAICAAAPDAILLPKVNSAQDITRLCAVLEAQPNCAKTRIWAMMETPMAVLNASGIAAASTRLRGMVLGTNDLAQDIGIRDRPDRASLQTGLGLCLLAARAFGLVCVDGVYNAFRDIDGLRAECEQGRDLGMDGKSLIHPSQIETANAVFAPSEAEIDLAHRQIAAFDATIARGLGIAVLDGKIVENLHVAAAHKILARLEAIKSLATAIGAR